MASRLFSRLVRRLSPSPFSSLSLGPQRPLICHLSTASRRRAAADIGARARQIQNRRLWTYALTLSGTAGFVVLVLATFQDQLVFYLTPTDALARLAADPKKTRLRLGGLVLEGSVVHPSNESPEMEFVITDLETDVLVRYTGSLPDLFKEGQSVVVEGFMKKMPDDVKNVDGSPAVSEKAREGLYYLKGTEVLAKHDEKYMPKEVAEALERNKKKLEAESANAAVSGQSGDSIVPRVVVVHTEK